MAESAGRPVALVTGASRGIGAATARELAARGYALLLAARSAEPLAALADELSRAGAPAQAIPADLSDPAAVARLAEQALAAHGRIDALVNNAGVGGGARTVEKLSPAEIRELLAVNLEAPIQLTRALLPHMLARRSGAIVMIGSVAGRIALPTSAIYSASKYGLRGFTLALRREVARQGVGVTLIAPGFIETAMTSRMRGVPKERPERVARAVAEAIARPRRERFVPPLYAAIAAIEQAAPWLADAILMRVRR